MNIKELKEKKQEYYSIAFKENKVFFAFDSNQFNNAIKEKNIDIKNDKLVSFGGGGYLPKSNLENLQKELAKIEKWYKNQVKEKQKELILYELKNYECFYSGDITDVLDVLLPYGIKKKDIEKVFLENRYKVNL